MQHVLNTQLDKDAIAVVLHDDDSKVEDTDTCSHLLASYRDLLLPNHSNGAVIYRQYESFSASH